MSKIYQIRLSDIHIKQGVLRVIIDVLDNPSFIHVVSCQLNSHAAFC